MQLPALLPWALLGLALFFGPWPMTAQGFNNVVARNATTLEPTGKSYEVVSAYRSAYPPFYLLGPVLPVHLSPTSPPFIESSILSTLQALDVVDKVDFGLWNSTILLLNALEIRPFGFSSAIEAIYAIDPISRNITDAGLPPPGLVIFCRPAPSLTTLGNPDMIKFSNDYIDGANVPRVMMTLNYLWDDTIASWQNGTPLTVSVTNNPGAWNKYAFSVGLGILNITMLVLGILTCIYIAIEISRIIFMYRLKRTHLPINFAVMLAGIIVYLIYPFDGSAENSSLPGLPVAFLLDSFSIDISIVFWIRMVAKVRRSWVLLFLFLLACLHACLVTIMAVVWIVATASNGTNATNIFFHMRSYIFPAIDIAIVIGLVLSISLFLKRTLIQVVSPRLHRQIIRLGFAMGVMVIKILLTAAIATMSNTYIFKPPLLIVRAVLGYLNFIICNAATVYFFHFGSYRQTLRHLWPHFRYRHPPWWLRPFVCRTHPAPISNSTSNKATNQATRVTDETSTPHRNLSMVRTTSQSVSVPADRLPSYFDLPASSASI